jgi:hypothetical protein
MTRVRSYPRLAILIAIATGIALSIAAAQAPKSPAPPALPASPVPSETASEPFVPEIGEVMMFQQIRHGKLWFAGASGNWPLANFEVDELREGFGTVAKYYPTWNDLPLGQMVESILQTNFSELDKAIAAHDRAQFNRAFDGLTNACNSCHQASNIGFVVIQRPTAPPFTDQTYTPRQ